MAVATAVAPSQGQRLGEQTDAAVASICSRVHARIGLLGNPSDGYHGKTISCSLANFYAEVRYAASTETVTAGVSRCSMSPFCHCIHLPSLQVVLTPAPTVSFEPHPEHDAQEFASITHLANRIDSHGYYGGVRLLMVSSTIKTQQLALCMAAPHPSKACTSALRLLDACSSCLHNPKQH